MMGHTSRRDTASLAARLAPPEEAGDGGPPAADTIRPEVNAVPVDDKDKEGKIFPLPRVVIVVVTIFALYAAAMFLLIWLRPEASRSPKAKRGPAGDSAPAPKNLLPPVRFFLRLLLGLALPEPFEYHAPPEI
jgi:hypothetical protein